MFITVHPIAAADPGSKATPLYVNVDQIWAVGTSSKTGKGFIDTITPDLSPVETEESAKEIMDLIIIE